MATENDENLLKPGKHPAENLRFMIFLAAIIQGVDEYQDLLRISVGSPGNDHRLGGNEAPPAIISMFLGDDLLRIVEAITEDKEAPREISAMMDMKASVLPDIKKDTTDRNRTSPFAFTGSRFEFRMAGAESSISCPVYMLNTIVAEELRKIADVLEASSDVSKDGMELVRKICTEHGRIIFNGDNYSEQWPKEAAGQAEHCCRKVIPAMDQVRAVCDKLEELTAEDCWPLPTYEEMLFS